MSLFKMGRSRKLRHRRATQRHSWLRLGFLSRGNRPVARRPERSVPHSGAHAADPAAPAACEDGRTLPNSAMSSAGHAGPKGGASEGRVLLRALLRVVAAVVPLVLAVGLLMLLRHVARTRPEFAIRAVRVSPTHHVASERLLEIAGVAAGQNLFTVDLEGVRRRVATEPWLRTVRVHRELPATVAIEVEEYAPAALIALEALYLVDPAGAVFKRATPEEALGRPVLTGVGREFFLESKEESTSLIKEALAALQVYEGSAEAAAASETGDRRRPALGEIHIDAIDGLTLYTSSGTALRLGRGEPAELALRLKRLDAVYAALPRGQVAQSIFLDNRAHPEHVTVRLATARNP